VLGLAIWKAPDLLVLKLPAYRSSECRHLVTEIDNFGRLDCNGFASFGETTSMNNVMSLYERRVEFPKASDLDP
jgi:hypothetical protein